MRLFGKFINTWYGKTVWFVLMSIIILEVQFKLLQWFLLALMTWYAVVYSEEIKRSANQRLWKLFAIVWPFMAYIILLIYFKTKSQQKDS